MATRDDLLDRCAAGLASARHLFDQGRARLRRRLGDGRGALLDEHQHAAHGLAWIATYVEALRQMLGWARLLDGGGRFGALERAMLRLAFGEYLAQLAGGIAMSQVETVRPADLGLEDDAVLPLRAAGTDLMEAAGDRRPWARCAALLIERVPSGGFGESALEDELVMVREQFRRYAEERVRPRAQEWHRRDALIPAGVLRELAELGVFGLTIPDSYGGLGMSKVAMCVVTEELSRGSLGVGSLGTRTEIAAELILGGGTEAQRQRWLPALASGAVIPTAVFTEPGTGSDLGSLGTRAVRRGDAYVVSGSKTWITHAARADLMTLLARTDPDERGYRGLSMFLAEKPRGGEDDPFPSPGLSGSEIPVIGYRGMKEYELGFDGFEVPADALLGGREGQGFKQLMATFEAARIQTAARAVGVAQAALELAFAYGRERRQFGRAIVEFPRIADKLVWMAVETMIARQLCWFAARRKDAGRRCDLEAGMAKLLAARVAWAAADNALQIHGGNGYAQEYEVSRLLCDARILSIFEGAAEIQAQVIARRLLDPTGG